MCNDDEQHVQWTEHRKLMQAPDLAIPSHENELDLPQADDIRLNDTRPVMRAATAIAASSLHLLSLNSRAKSTRRPSTGSC
jgi:hypothetical protein